MKKIIVLSIPFIIPVMLFIILSTARPAASAPLDQEITGVGAAWFNPDWHYRRPVTVTNGGAAIATNYQVLVTLNTANFDFTQAKSDGTDLRVTAGDGTTLLPFWIESWASPLAYVWVKLPSVSTGSVVSAYLYFSNTAASSASDGTQTFDLFEDTWPVCPAGIGTCEPLQGATQSWWETYTSYPMVFEDTSLGGPSQYHMLYDGHGVIGNAKGYAYSSDLYNWTEYDAGPNHPPNANPIMGTGYAGGGNYAWGDTIKVGSTYYMFASRGSAATQLITSTNLINWTGFTTLSDDDTGGNIGTGVAILKEPDGITPIIVDNRYWMVYFHDSASDYGTMYMASSPATGTLQSWNYTGSAFLPPTAGGFDAGGLWTPSFIRFGDMYYIYYQGLSSSVWETGYARASATSGGIPVPPNPLSTTWSKSGTGPGDIIPNAVLTRTVGSWDSGQVIDPMVRQFSDGVYYLFYTGNLANGYATSTSPAGPWVKVSVPGLRWTTNGTVTGGILRLGNGLSAQSTATFLRQAVGYRANFGSSTSAINMWGGFISGFTGPRTMIGTNRNDALDVNLGLRNYVSTERWVPIGAFRSDYHVYEVLWRNGLATGKVDHGLTVLDSRDVPTTALPITFYNYNNGTNPLLVDWVFVRQYRDPEPTTSVRDYSDIQETRAIGIGSNPFDLVYANIDVTTLGSLSSVQIVYYRHNHPNASGALLTGRYWEIIPNTANTDYTASLTVRHSLRPDGNDLLCFYYDPGTGWVWDCAATSFDPILYTITRGGLNHFSEWAVEENEPTAIRLKELQVFSKGNTLWWAGLVIGLFGAVTAVGTIWYIRMKRKA